MNGNGKLAKRARITTAVVVMVLASVAAADPDMVTVGNLGNSDDWHGDGYGAVGYEYDIGKYEVSNAEYTEFLNAVDADGSDPHDLHNSNMGGGYGGITYTAGNPNGSKYAVISGRGNMPVNYVSFWDACRFANWMHNGQGGGDTETGAYTLAADAITNNTVTRNAGWQWAVCSEDEWYKGAYYDGGSAMYYDYPTASNTAPTAESPSGGTNSANYDTAVGDLTDVGAYTSSDSPYGTFDQGGNVWEWNETAIGFDRGLRGGSRSNNASYLAASFRHYNAPALEHRLVGFRLASPSESQVVPEPISAAFMGSAFVGIVAAAMRRRRKRRA